MTKRTEKISSRPLGDEHPEKELSSLEESVAAKDAETNALKEEVARKEKAAEEYLEALKRIQAESENFRKRMIREQAQIVEFACQSLIGELLPLVDNLERAIESTKEAKDFDKLKEGVHLIYEQLRSVLVGSGLEAIDRVDEPFDPQLHEAVLQVESDEHEENTVVEVMQKGYCLKGRVMRPAMVKVTRKG